MNSRTCRKPLRPVIGDFGDGSVRLTKFLPPNKVMKALYSDKHQTHRVVYVLLTRVEKADINLGSGDDTFIITVNMEEKEPVPGQSDVHLSFAVREDFFVGEKRATFVLGVAPIEFILEPFPTNE